VLAVSACCCLHVRFRLLLLTHLQHRDRRQQQQQTVWSQDASHVCVPGSERLLLLSCMSVCTPQHAYPLRVAAFLASLWVGL
jgi:hypothetical protein